ncbi:MAG: family 43 glycosylhydrolase [Anaerolineae bacterium]|nr:family 43 glycosylhydrolase [Anaerolineae bacterium]NUQ04018.1 family 43 glycosylhydrolase [Anaerolineae bacterium]
MRNLFRCSLIVLALLALLVSPAAAQEPSDAPPGTFRNPLNRHGGADPWLTTYEGSYYLAATTGSSTLTLRRSPTLAGLKTAEAVAIYHETDPSRCCNMWAPEFHLLTAPDGSRHWYFYYSAGTAGTYDNQRTHVLESAGTDPLGPYTYKGRVHFPGTNFWMIDGSIVTLDGQDYFLYSSWVGELQSLFIAPMSDPWTLGAPGSLISRPDLPWERQGSNVNEGPAALYHGDETFIVYSASACATPDYKLGMLRYVGGDPLSPDSWVKHPEPIFSRSDANGVFAPGHNGFFKSPDGTEDWIVYHANDSDAYGCDGTRTTRAQPIVWNEDGTPEFGEPVAAEMAIPLPSGDTGTDIALPPLDLVRLESLSRRETYLRHSAFMIRQDSAVRPIADSMFVVVPGLADPEAISLESFNFPTFYLRQQDNVLFIAPDDGSAEFAGDATWWVRDALAEVDAGEGEWVSLESFSSPGRTIGRMMGINALSSITDVSPAAMREDATFRITRP